MKHIYRVTGYSCVLTDARIANVVMTAGQISHEGLITSATKRILSFSEIIIKKDHLSHLVVFGKEKNGRAIVDPDERVYVNTNRLPWFREDQWGRAGLFEPIETKILDEAWFLPTTNEAGERRWVLSRVGQIMPDHFIPRPYEVAPEYHQEIREAREKQRE